VKENFHVKRKKEAKKESHFMLKLHNYPIGFFAFEWQNPHVHLVDF